MNEEVKFLREHIKDICTYKGLQEELTYDVPLEILKRICKVLDFLQQENEELKRKLNEAIHKATEFESEVYELKKQLEENKNPLRGIFAQVNDDTLLRNCGIMNVEINELKNQQKEFIEYLGKRKNYFCKGCSHSYQDSLGKTRLVNEDIFNEVDTILSKYKEIIGSDISE